jgi:hypothetical protein
VRFLGVLQKFLEALKEHSKNVFGVAPHTTLSLYSIFAIASIIVPILVLLIALLLKII